jgi:hypothetical protein
MGENMAKNGERRAWASLGVAATWRVAAAAARRRYGAAASVMFGVFWAQYIRDVGVAAAGGLEADARR